VLELAKGQSIDDRENVLLIGSGGFGETHLAVALSLAAC
jgi:DNA replication protein DnaC